MKTGCPMRIVTRIPKRGQLAKIYDKELSEKAKTRLKIIDWYLNVSKNKSVNTKKNVSITCRHFGIERSYFYRWYSRFQQLGLAGLEEKSRKPKHLRQEKTNWEIIEEIKRIRQKDPSYSAKKIHPILLRYYEDYEVPCVSTISNIIKRHNFFFRPDLKSFKKRSKSGQKARERKRITGNLHGDANTKIIEFDMKHIRIPNMKKLYAFVGIDVFRKSAIITISKSCSSSVGKVCYKKVVKKFGTDAIYVNDNGSENQGEAEEWLKQENITQLWARPHTPKDKPCVERMIKTFQVEFLDYLVGPYTVEELQKEVDIWLEKYHKYRPHESLNFLTPSEFEAKLNSGFSMADVS